MSIVYEGSPLDTYLKEAEIDEETSPAVADEEREGNDLEPAGPDTSAEGDKDGSPSIWTILYQRAFDRLPLEVSHILGLVPSRSESTSERYKYILCSSSLLDASLPRTTEPLVASDLSSPHTPPTSSPASLLLAPGPTISSSLIFYLRKPPWGLVIALVLVGLVLPLSPIWGTTLFVLFTILVRRELFGPSQAGSERVCPTLGRRGEESMGPAQRDTIECLKELVHEAEAFDRILNSTLSRVWEADEDALVAAEPPSALPLLALRRTILSTVSSLTALSEVSATSLRFFTTSFELNLLRSMYNLSTGSSTLPFLVSQHSPGLDVSEASFEAPSDLRPVFDPLGGGATRFASPPTSRVPSLRSSVAGLDEQPFETTPVRYTQMPKRTPRSLKRSTWSASGSPSLFNPLIRPPTPPSFRVAPGTPIYSEFASPLSAPPTLLPLPRSTACLPADSHSPFISGGLTPLDISDTESTPSPSRRSPTINASKRRSLQNLHNPAPADSPSRAGSKSVLCSGPRPGRVVPVASPSRPSPSVRRIRRLTLPYQSKPEASSIWDEDRLKHSHRFPPSLTPSRIQRGSPSIQDKSPDSLAFSAERGERRRIPDAATSSPASATFSDLYLEEEEEEPSPLSHSHLLSKFLTLHTRRRHALVCFLALKKSAGPEYWEDVMEQVLLLLKGFQEGRKALERELFVSKQSWGGGGAGEIRGWAPRQRTIVEGRAIWVEKLADGVGRLLEKLREDQQEEGFDGWWEGLRDDLSLLVRVWERGREEVGSAASRGAVDVPTEDATGSTRNGLGLGEIPLRPRSTSPPPPEDDDPDATDLAKDDLEDDVTLHFLATAQLPPPGREQLFAASSTPTIVNQPHSTLSREERIRLAREKRAEELSHGGHRGAVRGMGEVVSELKGLMGELRRLKGPATGDMDGEDEEGEVEQPVEETANPKSKLRSQTETTGRLGSERAFKTPPPRKVSSSSSCRFPGSASSPASPASQTSPRPTPPDAPPFLLLSFALPSSSNPSSLPALSSGSSDGEEEADAYDALGEGSQQGFDSDHFASSLRNGGEGLGCGDSESTLGERMTVLGM